MTTHKIDTPQGLDIVREINALIHGNVGRLDEIQNKTNAEMEKISTETDALIKENFERLRLLLNLPTLVNPQIDDTYLDDHSIVFLHEGVEVKSGTLIDLIKTKLSGMSEN